MIDNKCLGNNGEEIAVLFLKEQGLEILDRNFYTRHSEIDIVALDGDTYVFVEVKYRESDRYGDPLEAITRAKQRRLYNAARVYFYEKHLPESTPARFDAIGICKSSINWIKDAFIG